jgi:hypothetical protein
MSAQCPTCGATEHSPKSEEICRLRQDLIRKNEENKRLRAALEKIERLAGGVKGYACESIEKTAREALGGDS